MPSIYGGLVCSGPKMWDRWRLAPGYDRGAEADAGVIGIGRLVVEDPAEVVSLNEL